MQRTTTGYYTIAKTQILGILYSGIPSTGQIDIMTLRYSGEVLAYFGNCIAYWRTRMYPKLKLIHWGSTDAVSALCLHSPRAYYRLNSRMYERIYVPYPLTSASLRPQDICLASGGRILWELWNILEVERAEYESNYRPV